MITNPQSKVILCFGDSNTWGQNDNKNVAGRYSVDTRWTGYLQELLGDDYYIIEEGLGGRTTDLEHYNPKKPSRNGFTYFMPCLTSHSPLDIVIIMLGTNDLKVQYNRSVEEIAKALIQYVETIRQNMENTHILLVSPIWVDDTAPLFQDYYHDTYDSNSALKSKRLAQEIQKVATDNNCYFYDASSVAKAGLDGIHFDVGSHQKLANALAEVIRGVN